MSIFKQDTLIVMELIPVYLKQTIQEMK